mgnify:CR=1 FL=1|tara:strand:+ start:1373 stop:1729 length:357 start_codon:yes stop_codon:yes gene_type:complete
MTQEELIKKIQEILVKYTPVKVHAMLRDTGWIPRSEIHTSEAIEILKLLPTSTDVRQLQKGIYNSFVKNNEYHHDWEKASIELDGGEPSTLEHSSPGIAGKLGDYTTIAQEVFALKTR